MTSKRRLSQGKFMKRHPDLELEIHLRGPSVAMVVARSRDEKQRVLAVRVGRNLERQLYELSEACYKLASLDAMDRQEWKDVNTGQTGVPLQAHHIQKRSKGRLDSTKNLAGTTAETHSYQHEKKHKSKEV